MTSRKPSRKQDDLIREIENFEAIARGIIPTWGEIPKMENIDIYGGMLTLDGLTGGDHIIYIDFKTRYDLENRISLARKNGQEQIQKNLLMNLTRAGVLLADVSGHKRTDAFLAGRLHDAFLTGVLYELNYHGQVTPQLFEILNTRFYNSSSIDRFVTMVYGEISEAGKFRFISAGAPPPVVYSSKYDKFLEITPDRFTLFPPLGVYPSESDVDKKKNYSLLGYKEKYTINEINLLGAGDILFLYTDGLADHCRGEESFFPGPLEDSLKKCKTESAAEIWEQVKTDILEFNSDQTDDISFMVIKNMPGGH